MELKETKKIRREDKLKNAQFLMIETTGKISGNVKDILYLQDKNERIKKIKNLEGELKKLVSEIYDMSKSLNLNFDEIIKGAKNDI